MSPANACDSYTGVAAGALLLGMRLRDRVDAATYQRWLRKGLVGMAVVLAVQFVSGLFESG